MIIEWDVPISTDDGVVLRADVFRPDSDRPCPVLLSHGPYGKGLWFPEGRAREWSELVASRPEVVIGSTNRYQCWEVPDPERFVPHGYACVRVDSRGAGRSPGFLDPLSPTETRDLFACIEWAGTRSWSNGRVGLLGVSYYAINQWQVAALKPPHLAAICPWEGGADFYRDLSRHGGILSRFFESWYERRVLPVQHGVGTRGFSSAVTGELVAGPETLSDEELASNRVDLVAALREHVLDDEFHRLRSPVLEDVSVPLLSAANWGGQGLHSRGNFEGFEHASSSSKWLEVHGGSHFDSFYSTRGIDLQRSFFDCFLKDEPGDLDHEGRVLVDVRLVGGFRARRARCWPLEGTSFTQFHLDAAASTISEEAPSTAAVARYDALGPAVTFLSRPSASEIEITGPLAAHLHISTTARDADLFVVVHLFDDDGREVVFQGAQDPRGPITHGWLRLSHREEDEEASTPWRPYHRHSRLLEVSPGTIYRVAIELWPTSIVVPAGYRLGVSVGGRDYENAEVSERRGITARPMHGSGRCVHDDPVDRDVEMLAGEISLHTGPEFPSHLVLPLQR